MSRLGKLSFTFAAITLLCFAISKSFIPGWIPFFWVLIGLFVLFVAVGFIVDRKFFAEFLTLKTTKHGMNMGALIVGFIALMVIANIFGARYYKTWDFSVNQLNTLSDQSVKVLNDLKSEMKIVYLYKKDAKNYDINRRMFTDLIRKYQDQSTKIKLEFFEAAERPDIAEKYEFKGDQAVFLDYNGKKGRVDKIDEQELTNALIKVTREKSKSVYFTTGHGEPELESFDKAEGLGNLKQLLENNNYTVKTLNLSGTSKMPEDMDVLFIVGPQFPFQNMEVQALEAFLKAGGSLLVSLEFPDKSGLDKLLSNVGVETQNFFIMNVLNSPMGPIVDPNGPTKGSSFSTSHAITKVFRKNDGVLFLKPVAVKKAAKVPEGITVDEILNSPSSVSFTDPALKDQGEVANYNLAVAVNGVYPNGGDKNKPFNLVVLGDTQFMQNQLLYSFVNRDLVLNSIALLAKEDSLISITPKEPTGSKMELTSAREAVLLWGFFLPIPLFFAIFSLFFWIRRRHA